MQDKTKDKTKLLFDKPATNFLETIPLGNGRLGALIYGQILRDQIILNESSMWSGSREESNRKDAGQYLDIIRKLLSQGRNYEAEQVFSSHFTCQGKGSNYGHGADACFGCYQVLGRLSFSYFQAISHGRPGCYGATKYRRELNLIDGIASIEFLSDGIYWKRECLVSYKREAIYFHLSAKEDDKPAKERINLTLGIDRDECYEIKLIDSLPALMMYGQLDDGKGTKEGICYACCVSVTTKGGKAEIKGPRIVVTDADEATVVVTARTNLSGFLSRVKIDEQKETLDDLLSALKIPWNEVKEEHICWFQRQMRQMCLWLGENTNDSKVKKPLPERISNFNQGENDLQLINLYVQYARYLLISSSQKGGFPANLQGIWSDEIQTPWNGDWHLNAQQELYWMAEKSGLSENHLPFLELTRSLVEPGSNTAQCYYHAHGWVVHTMTNPWGITSPMENASWGSTTGSAAWQCFHVMEHYLYTLDVAYLQEYWHVLKEAAEFYIDLLVEQPDTGWLVTSPSSSPENKFLDEEGRVCSLCEGPTYDRMLVKELFHICIEAQYVLKNDLSFCNRLKNLETKLAPIQIGPDGRILEWGQNYLEALPFHRHLSHLWGVYPGNLISKEKTPELAEAAKKSLLRRGTTTAGWACAYRACIAARLRDGDAAYEYIKDSFQFATAPNFMNLAYHCDETTIHHDKPHIGSILYPFQMDGNQANAAAILLMILDDDAEILPDGNLSVRLYLLPALPKAFDTGTAIGIRAKGNLTVNLSWNNGKLTKACIYGKPGMTFEVVYKGMLQNAKINSNGYYFLHS